MEDLLKGMNTTTKSYLHTDDQKKVMLEHFTPELWKDAVNSVIIYSDNRQNNVDMILKYIEGKTLIRLKRGKRYTPNNIGNNAVFEIMIEQDDGDNVVIGAIYMNDNMYGSYMIGLSTINGVTESREGCLELPKQKIGGRY